MTKIKAKKVRTFKEAVEATSEVKDCYAPGLRALGAYSSKISVTDTSKCEGSLDVDASVSKLYPQSNRWDYALCYNSEVYFVEVHTANSSEVSVVKRKLQWLRDWLHTKAPHINEMKVKGRTPYYWVQSNGCHIPKTTSQFRQAAQAGIMPIPKLKLP